ncbi:MAG: DUF222 domain-containing protein [Acidimicrobiales bacterium]
MNQTDVPDLSMVSAEDLADRLCSWAGSVAASEYRWLKAVAEFDRRGLYERWECRTCAHWLMWRCSLDIRSAHDKVRVARTIESLPAVSAAFAAGELSYSKVRALTRVATPADEERWVDIARSVPTTGLEHIVAGVRRAVHLNSGAEERRQARRGLVSRYEDDGMVTTMVRLPIDEHALLTTALNAVLEPDAKRSAEQRRADALLEVVAQFLARGGRNADHPVRTADRYQTVVHVDADALAGADDPDRPGEATVDGRAVPVETVQRLCCDGSVVWLVENGDGEPVGVTRKTRTVPAALRRALQTRDRMCRFPGCANRGWLDAHHLIHWADGGPTTLDNLTLLCRHHHRAVHEGNWLIEHHPEGGLRFISPRGWSLHAVSPPLVDLDVELIDPHTIVPNWYGDPIDLHYITAVMTQPPPTAPTSSAAKTAATATKSPAAPTAPTARPRAIGAFM